jgi:hypothetical protein
LLTKNRLPQLQYGVCDSTTTAQLARAYQEQVGVGKVAKEIALLKKQRSINYDFNVQRLLVSVLSEAS